MYKMNSNVILRLPGLCSFACNHTRNLSSATAVVTRTHRSKYLRVYPVRLVQPDGSSIEIRYYEPRAILQLPVDMATLTQDEIKMRLEKRKPKSKVKLQKEEKNTFDPNKYIRLVKK